MIWWDYLQFFKYVRVDSNYSKNVFITSCLYLSLILVLVSGEKSLNDEASIVPRRRFRDSADVSCSSFAMYAAVRALLLLSLDELGGRDRKASATVLDPIIFSEWEALAAFLSE